MKTQFSFIIEMLKTINSILSKIVINVKKNRGEKKKIK